MGSVALRILTCDERSLVRGGIRSLLASEPDAEVVAEAVTPGQAVAAIRAHRPDVVVTSMQLARLSGPELVRYLRQTGDDDDGAALDVPVVVYAVEPGDQGLADVLRAGASGLLADDASNEELVLAIRAVADGGAMLGSSVARRVVDWFRVREAPLTGSLVSERTSLTARENEILVLTAHGLSTEDIARRLFIGVATVRTHIYRLRLKLQLRDRAQLVSYAYQSGLMQPQPT
ncbi:DNA-binding response regulator [Streptomyces solincola]|uniref:DNA-binding response regulator n=1 Tax=Streptomyces solincola TaxID=2100817 RepID=A0A2S9PX47_9ACTN|nr:DNA-binding response regulator [Streptomyces solincola]